MKYFNKAAIAGIGALFVAGFGSATATQAAISPTAPADRFLQRQLHSFARLQLYVDAANGITQPHQPSYQVQAGVNPSPTLIDDLLTFTVGFVVGKHDEFVVKMMAVARRTPATAAHLTVPGN